MRDDVPKLPTWTYWHPIVLPPLRLPSSSEFGEALGPGLPLDAAQIGGEAWARAPMPVKDLVRSVGFGGALDAASYETFSELYADLRAQGVASTVTLDSLFFATELALRESLHDAAVRVVAPSLVALLTRLDSRLLEDSQHATADMRPAFDIARGVVLVGLVLADPSYTPKDADPPATVGHPLRGSPSLPLSERVRHDVASALAGLPFGPCAVLEANCDFSSLKGRDTGGRSADLTSTLLWLSHADLVLTGRTEKENVRPDVDVAISRVHTRAALLLAHAVSAEIDPEASTELFRIERVADFALGESGGSDPGKAAKTTRALAREIADTSWMENVVLVDRIRHQLSRGGQGGAFHLLGRRTPADTRVLSALSGRAVGSCIGCDPAARDNGRTATALDVAAWLGSAEALRVIHERGADDYSGYHPRLELLYLERPAANAEARHANLWLSWLDALATYLAPSAGDSVIAGAHTDAFARRKLEAMLSAWTLAREAVSLGAVGFLETEPKEPPSPALRPIPHEPSPVFVEPHPEAIAKLLAFERQFAEGMKVFGALPSDGRAFRLVSAVDGLLRGLLDVAVHETNDEPFTVVDEDLLTHIPERFREIESLSSARKQAVSVPLVLGNSEVTEQVSGPVPLVLVMRHARTHRLEATVGGILAHRETVEGALGRAPPPGTPAPVHDDFAASYLVKQVALDPTNPTP